MNTSAHYNKQDFEEEFSLIKIKLPTYLAKWLKKVSRSLAMEQDQFLTRILKSYKAVWDAVQRIMEEELLRSRSTINVEEILEKYKEYLKRRNLKQSTITTYKYAARKMLNWI